MAENPMRQIPSLPVKPMPGMTKCRPCGARGFVFWVSGGYRVVCSHCMSRGWVFVPGGDHGG